MNTTQQHPAELGETWNLDETIPKEIKLTDKLSLLIDEVSEIRKKEPLVNLYFSANKEGKATHYRFFDPYNKLDKYSELDTYRLARNANGYTDWKQANR